MLTDEHWAMILAALPVMAKEAGHEPNDKNCLFCMKVHWKLLSDAEKLKAYVDKKNLAAMKRTKAEAEQKIELLTAMIEKAEAANPRRR